MDSYFLLIETSNKVCSASLCKPGGECINKESFEPNSHSKYLTLYVEDLLSELDNKKQQLLAIGVSAGPGSYTGLRIGVSVAKGLAYSLDIPLISAGTLETMVQTLLRVYPQQAGSADFLVPMIDARRMEVYTAVFDSQANRITDIKNIILDQTSFEDYLKDRNKVLFFGDGSEKFKDLVNNENASFIDGIYPLSRDMLPLVKAKFDKQEFEDVAYFEPFYLKPFIPTTKPKQLLQ